MQKIVIHRDIKILIERMDDDTFTYSFQLNGQAIHRWTKTRLPNLAERRACMLLDRILRERSARAKNTPDSR
jgi:hypothetical protein